jgi:hypothetical protein
MVSGLQQGRLGFKRPGFNNDVWSSVMPSGFQQWRLGFCNGVWAFAMAWRLSLQ